MTVFPRINDDYYDKYSHFTVGEKIAAAIAIEPPVIVTPKNREHNLNHAKIYYSARAYITWMTYAEGIKGTLSFYGIYAIRAYSHFYKARKVEEIYSGDVRRREGEQNLKRRHMLEAAASVALLGASILYPGIAYPLYVANSIVNETMHLVTAVKAKDKVTILEKIASITIKTFALFTFFNPHPISRIALLTFKILEASYYINKALNRDGEIVHRLGPVMPTIVDLTAQIPALLRAVRAA